MASKTRGGQSDRFGTMELSPGRNEPLIRPGSDSLEALATPSVSLTLCVASAMALRPMQKGITSNPMCEISLVLDDGQGHRLEHHHHQHQQYSTGDANTDRKLMQNRTSSTAQSIGNGVLAKTFKTKVVRSSLNPIWNLDVDFGDYNAQSVLGVLLVVKHIEKMGMVKKDIGQVLIPMRDLLELKTQPSREQTFTLEATDDVNAREAQEGMSNRKYGKVLVRFNSYGLSSSPPAVSNYTGLMNNKQDQPSRPTSLSDAGSVTHEDDFTTSGGGGSSISGAAGASSSSSSSSAAKTVHNVQQEIKKLQSFHQSKPLAGETWYAINSQWISNWLLFVSKHRGKSEFNPGQIDNMALIDEDLSDGLFVVRPTVVIKKDFRMINKPSWEYYQAQYGGGPAIQVPVPSDCVDTVAWLASLELHESAHVGSGYY